MIKVDPTMWPLSKHIKGVTSIKDVVEINDHIGEGSFGAVYRGVWNHKDVAVKEQNLIVEDDYEESSNDNRLQSEIESLYRATNCKYYVAQLYDVIYDSSLYKLYFIMELIDGNDLENFVFNDDPDLSRVIYSLVKGIDCLHKHGIIHRDVKPANIMKSSKNGTIKFVDFGLSCLSICDDNVGTPIFAAPETKMHNVKTFTQWKSADMWSLGSTIYTLATGHSYPLQDIIFALPIMDVAREINAETLRQSENNFKYLEEVKDRDTKIYVILQLLLEIDPNKRLENWKEVCKISNFL